jgi:hypothetical protein
VRRILPALGDEVLTGELDDDLAELTDALETEGCRETAAAVAKARSELAASVGSLNSRSTRVPAASG